jgi:hypothetical protein
MGHFEMYLFFTSVKRSQLLTGLSWVCSMDRNNKSCEERILHEPFYSVSGHNRPYHFHTFLKLYPPPAETGTIHLKAGRQREGKCINTWM